MGIAAELRHKRILEDLHFKGRVYVNEISEELRVTEVTIRRDLVFLEGKGLLKKTYGGAVVVSPEVTPSVHYRQKKKLDAKKVIGQLASKLIKDGDVIYLEAGSTCFEIIPYLANKKDLTILVNSLYLMRRLAELTHHRIIIIGGQ